MQRDLRGPEEKFPIGSATSSEIAGLMDRLIAGVYKINKALATPRSPLNSAMGKVRRVVCCHNREPSCYRTWLRQVFICGYRRVGGFPFRPVPPAQGRNTRPLFSMDLHLQAINPYQSKTSRRTLLWFGNSLKQRTHGNGHAREWMKVLEGTWRREWTL